jgi:hypothetical protein
MKFRLSPVYGSEFNPNEHAGYLRKIAEEYKVEFSFTIPRRYIIILETVEPLPPTVMEQIVRKYGVVPES